MGRMDDNREKLPKLSHTSRLNIVKIRRLRILLHLRSLLDKYVTVLIFSNAVR